MFRDVNSVDTTDYNVFRDVHSVHATDDMQRVGVLVNVMQLKNTLSILIANLYYTAPIFCSDFLSESL